MKMIRDVSSKFDDYSILPKTELHLYCIGVVN